MWLPANAIIRTQFSLWRNRSRTWISRNPLLWIISLPIRCDLFLLVQPFLRLWGLWFFISPDDLILHRKIFLEFMLPAAYGGFLTASMLEWTNYKGNLKPITTILAVLFCFLDWCYCHFPASCLVSSGCLLVRTVTLLCLAVLVGIAQYWQFHLTDVTCRIYGLSDCLRHDW